MFVALCLVYPIGCTAFIYLAHNPSFLSSSAWAVGGGDREVE